jgi:hypothetical protein
MLQQKKLIGTQKARRGVEMIFQNLEQYGCEEVTF